NILDYASNEWKVWDTDIYNVFADRDKIDFYVKGDWKHDHWAFDDALKEYLSTNYPNMKYELDKYEIDDGNEYDSDNYPAVHSLIILKDEGPLVLNLLEPDNEAIVESLNESEEMSDQELMQSMIKQLNNSLGENPSKSQLHNYNQRVREIRKMFMDESLNESYIEEWWGQTDEDPHDLEAYGLKVIKKDVVGDSTLYRFVGRRSDLERAMSDGYFMAFEYGEDVEHSKDLDKTYDKLVDELIVELHKIGFELDNSVEYPVGKNLFGGKHIQVINPNLKYPSFETEGEELSEEEAHKLFRDDLKEIEYILDKFEEDNEIMLTFNFGPNKDMVITGGIDIR
ncbi:MAG: hypothetical protein IJH55_03985, partial [Romboutsia sp.]|nr:hypothetical protein [Romboutsia sp.]